MPYKSLDEIKNLKTYKATLKAELLLAKTKVTPFFFAESFTFAGNKKGPVLLLGRLTPELIVEVKKNSLQHATGRCRNGAKGLLLMPEKGVFNEKKLSAIFTFAQMPLKPPPQIVEDLVEARAQDMKVARDEAMADLEQGKKGITDRFKNISPMLGKEQRIAIQREARAFTDAMKAGDVDLAYEKLAEVDRLLSAAEAEHEMPVEHQPIRPVDSLVQANRHKEGVRRALDQELLRPELKKPGKLADRPDLDPTREIDDGEGHKQRSVKQAFDDRQKGMAWQDERVKEGKDATKKLGEIKTLIKQGVTALEKKLAEDKRALTEKSEEIKRIDQELQAIDSDREEPKETLKTYNKDKARIENSNLGEQLLRDRLAGLEKDKKDAEKAIEQLNARELVARGQRQLAQDQLSAIRLRMTGLITQANVELKEQISLAFPGYEARYPAVASTLDTVLEKMEKALPDPEVLAPDLSVLSGRHGTGRHGAQTGIEHQARRVATGGITADQEGNEFGTSRPMEKEDGNPIESVKWRKVTIEYKEDAKGNRILGSKTVKSVLREVLREVDTRVSAASASSMFHSPELEKEAVERAIDIVKTQCLWDQVKSGENWEPIDRVAVTISAPRIQKSVGWGLSLKAHQDRPKHTVGQANKVIERFRKGEISVDELLEGLNSELERDAQGGAKMVRSAKVIVSRLSGGWTSTTHYPCSDPPGWDLEKKTVRKTGQPELVAPACVNP